MIASPIEDDYEAMDRYMFTSGSTPQSRADARQHFPRWRRWMHERGHASPFPLNRREWPAAMVNDFELLLHEFRDKRAPAAPRDGATHKLRDLTGIRPYKPFDLRRRCWR